VGPDARALLPLDDAHDVPTNAALIASATMGGAVFWLRQVGPEPNGDADAGSDPTYSVNLDVQCIANERSGTDGGAVCVAHGTLKPNTEYEWSVNVESFDPFSEEPMAEVGVSPEEFGQWHRFTTGDATVQPPTDSVGVAVTDNREYLEQTCGDGKSVLLEIDGSRLSQPVVGNVRGVTPGYVMHAVAVAPGQSVELRLGRVPTCAPLELFDQTGQAQILREICFDEELPPSSYGADGQIVPDAPPSAVDDDEPAANPAPASGDLAEPPSTADPVDPKPTGDGAGGSSSAEPTDGKGGASQTGRIDEGVVTRGVDDEGDDDSGCAMSPRRYSGRDSNLSAFALFGFALLLRRLRPAHR